VVAGAESGVGGCGWEEGVWGREVGGEGKGWRKRVVGEFSLRRQMKRGEEEIVKKGLGCVRG